MNSELPTEHNTPKLTTRYFLELSYKGTAYSGWQLQQNALTVQQCLNYALKTVFGQQIETVGSGRTDAGVHAKMQVVHLDLPEVGNPSVLCHKLNGILPFDISVHSIRAVKPDAHARFDAKYRRYEYYFHNRKDPFNRELGYFFHHDLDFEAMEEASALLSNHINYQAFSKVNTDVSHFNCSVHFANWQHLGPNKFMFTIQANRFLRGMVRAISGTLIEVGMGRMSIDKFKQVLNANHRSEAARSLPAHGLFLVDVGYPSDLYL